MIVIDSNNTTSKYNLTSTQCVFDSINLCQKPGSGGHPGTIMSVDKLFCAKKVELGDNDNNLEIKFLNNEKNQSMFEGFIPIFKGFCNSNNKKYIMIENLKYNYENPIVLDIKIGFKTVNKEILDLLNLKKNKTLKLLKHSFIDNHSSSSKYGYRVEGFEGNKYFSKGTLKSMKPKNIFKIYFEKDYNNVGLKNIISKLKVFQNIIMKPDFNSYVLTGSSLLFIYDSNNQSNNSVKMIDFSNSYVYTPETLSSYNATFVESYRKAIKNLINDLTILLNSKKVEFNVSSKLSKTSKLSRKSLSKYSIRKTLKKM